MKLSLVAKYLVVGSVPLALSVACGSAKNRGQEVFENGPGGGDPNTPDFAGDGGFEVDGSSGLPVGETRDPVDCEEAKTSKSYVGCDYWPTVTANPVWSIFDFAAVVANTGANDATLTITGPNSVNRTVTVKAGSLEKVTLPWVPSLKGPDMDECGQSVPPKASVLEQNGAYHIVSSTPVIVYQFNALEYKGVGGATATGAPKDWSQCPGTVTKCDPGGFSSSRFAGCFSFSNDASLLLPSTAMTGNYRITAMRGQGPMGGYFTVTATAPDTDVTVALSRAGAVLAGAGIAATNGGGTLKFKLANAGDVAQVLSQSGEAFDPSGSLVQATKPVQVIAGFPCINLPSNKLACDHLEETVLPSETLGKHYLVHQPTGPTGKAKGHFVRFYGNRDSTSLTYGGTKPPRCPDILNAGQVVDCDVVTSAFEVTGDHEFAVATFQLGAQAIAEPPKSPFDPGDTRGDPSQTNVTAIEQFRTKYVFLAPDDYDVNFVDITATTGAEVVLDGKPVTLDSTKVGKGDYSVTRIKLGAGDRGAHSMTSKLPVGIQVVGYGANTSYGYPGGLNLKLIAPPPDGPR
jgi:hypothetical protein